ncbi:ABC transporter permease [Afifella sp. IM 167]|uniref:ABC transporter permease n=1 Tax=Afifella sp. IM 167 TaxID=2033586 RepID=UPI001CD012E3|nr:ABC transporter permease subunit [Afifella sp. IM 167]MBZ8132063.1 peptide ABC transporter permease [Afifella sp. IM 167]
MSIAEEPVTLQEPAASGRSLWQDALRRLRRNKAAMTSLVVLCVMALASIVGPAFWPHPYDRVYSEYVRVPASLEAYPKEDRIVPEMERSLKRARVAIGEISLKGDTVHATISDEEEIDPRITRYVDRSDLFSNARLAEKTADGKGAVMVADVARLRFIAGTDGNGRDLFARILMAIRISLAIGLLATFVALVIGVAYGATAGYLGGRADNVMMRVVDILYSLPFIFFVILLVVFFGRNFVLMFIAVGAIEWLDMARIVRGQTLTLKRREFVEAAEALGVSDAGIVRRHIIPNVLGPVAVYMTLLVPKVILLESFLSFLGLGVQAPLTSLGVLISEGAKNMQGASWLLIYPSIALALILFSLNFIGDGLRDALDPKDR